MTNAIQERVFRTFRIETVSALSLYLVLPAILLAVLWDMQSTGGVWYHYVGLGLLTYIVAEVCGWILGPIPFLGSYIFIQFYVPWITNYGLHTTALIGEVCVVFANIYIIAIVVYTYILKRKYKKLSKRTRIADHVYKGKTIPKTATCIAEKVEANQEE